MIRHQENTLTLRTPEGVRFSLVLAGPSVRFLALLIDWLCILLVLSVLGLLVTAASLISLDFSNAVSILLSFLVGMGYSIVCEWWWNGQTLGKRMFNLRVMDRQGLKLRFSQVMVRNLLRTVDSLPLFYMVGGITCFLNKRSQRLGDLAAHTIVIRNRKTILPDFDQLFSDKYNSFKDYPHLAARLRQNIDPNDAAIGLQSLVRRDELRSQDRIALFSELAAHYRKLVAFPDEAVDGLSDERYVRNVIDLVYRQ
ncbi:MAG: RDD family protein [Desulfuromonadales bacterium]|nr:RDD family protein [Desulfuromonadales bacterium]